jgi:hypothetical protein
MCSGKKIEFSTPLLLLLLLLLLSALLAIIIVVIYVIIIIIIIIHESWIRMIHIAIVGNWLAIISKWSGSL